MLEIFISNQTCRLIDGANVLFESAVSTALNGAGEQKDSGRTPRGLHSIRACIGTDLPENTVFIGRRATGEIYTAELGEQFPERDWILSRILWLNGMELAKNRLANVDTMQRYIYIHGCPDTAPMGVPLSHGCIRMRNKDVIELFDLVQAGLSVMIHE